MCSTPSEKDAKYKNTQKDLRDKLISHKIFNKDKIRFLPDAILSSKKIITSRLDNLEKIEIIDKKKMILNKASFTRVAV